MNFRSSILGAAALVGLSATAAWAQEEPADPIANILEQTQEAPADPTDPEAESVPPPPGAPPAQEVVPPAQPPPAPFQPQTPASPPPPAPGSYLLPPVNHAPSPSAPMPYARPPADYTPAPAPPPAPYAPSPAASAPVVPYAPPYVPPPPRPQLTEPVHIDETGKTPDAPPGAVDRNYEARLRASSASAQGLQGPLDGAWTLRASGNELYSLLLVDSGATLEGAWRDPRRRGAVDSSGFLNDIQRTGAGVTLNFYSAPGAGLTTITLAPTADGSWNGEIDENGRRRNVTLRRH